MPLNDQTANQSSARHTEAERRRKPRVCHAANQRWFSFISSTRNTLLNRLLSLFCLFAMLVSETQAAETTSKSYPVLSGIGLALKREQGHILVGSVVEITC
jgi:hypothetical protein